MALHPLRWHADGSAIEVIDQTRLPHREELRRLSDRNAVAQAIRSMVVRGAPLIGACAAWGLVFALREDPSDAALQASVRILAETRPTAVNLGWALARMLARVQGIAPALREQAAVEEAIQICLEDIEQNRRIGEHGLAILRRLHHELHRPLRVLTHCNAGWLATLRWGTALAPLYLAQQAGLPIEVWVDETRPRNQGALTAWELGRAGIAHTVIVDNAGGHLMQHGQVDLVIVGADRVTATGDVCNKIGTYLKALAARDCSVPFYAAVPSPSIDWQVRDGLREIPIEERHAQEVAGVSGLDASGAVGTLRLFPAHSRCANPAFDVTPSRLVDGIITEHGVYQASAEGLAPLGALLALAARR
ncbi:MAG: S-methyl-5-thioribose-1-phosphate isomerase [Pseudomonadota bacterium]|nr:S-methyl-5-thioribose-1-phosphate isomerase [Pseudomonadota bacterium]